ncbi:sulfatase-like hydrolase/transferase [Thalassotalea fonticola]|uniref:Sulfatase-like hydrolase/transferase n=1 Tax=Thalassotalea fonticola TaxID=3065649 RepID=A0ABZ0GV13_9GAMM|nr:sulfatase-like hydrolase/transferase [Colwelliaceae bacterium S1-1]
MYRKFYQITALLLASFMATNVAADGNSQPNIVLIVTDDQHRIDFNFLKEGRDQQGKPLNLSPNIDKLANEGIIFDQMYATSTVCTPSRFSVLTGNLASRATNSRFTNDLDKYKQANVAFNTHIEPHDDSIAKVLQKSGYFTGGVGKNHVYESEIIHKIKRNVDVSKAEVIKQLRENQQAQIKAYKDNGFDYADRIYTGNVPGQYPKALEAHNQDWITEGAINFLDMAVKKDNPFFLYFATTLEHGPHKQGKKYLGDPRMTPVGLLADEELPNVQPTRDSITKRIKQHGLENRAADVLWLDDAVGALMTKLEKTKELDNTIIFYFNDHGVEGGKGSMYQGGALTPSFVWFGNKFKGARRINDIVANIDIAPTIYELAQVSKAPKTDGNSMVSLYKGDNSKWRNSLVSEIGATRAIIKDGWKYIAYRVPQEKLDMPMSERKKLAQTKGKSAKDLPWMHMGGTPGGRGLEHLVVKTYGAENYFATDQLYRYLDDPKEKNNVIDNPENKTIVEQLKQKLAEELKNRPGSFAEFTE